MRIPRLFLNEELAIGKSICLKDDLAHRLLHVLRVKEGYQVVLFDGSGDQFLTKVEKCTRREVQLAAISEAQSCAHMESPLAIHLVQAISKTDRMDWAIQKAVELGVQEITPVVAEYTHLKRTQTIYEAKQRHYEKVITHAVEQSGRGILPQLNPIIELPAFMSTHSSDHLTAYLSPRGEQIKPDLLQKQTEKRVTLLIGGEGGFSDDEETRMAGRGWAPIRLGPRILRTETAPVAILSILQFLAGDFC